MSNILEDQLNAAIFKKAAPLLLFLWVTRAIALTILVFTMFGVLTFAKDDPMYWVSMIGGPLVSVSLVMLPKIMLTKRLEAYVKEIEELETLIKVSEDKENNG